MVTTRSNRHKTPTKRGNTAKHSVLDNCCKEIAAAIKKNDGRKPYGMVADMVKELETGFPWINRHVINYAFDKYTAAQKAMAVEAPIADVDNNSNLGGRPVGTTNKEKHDLKSRTRLCLDAVATEFHEKRNIAKRDGKYVKKGCLDDIIKQQKRKFNLSDSVKIDQSAIRARHYRGRLKVKSFGPASPMADVEPKLVELIVRMSRIRRCLTATQCLLLANDLIEGTEYETKVVSFKRGRYEKMIWAKQILEKNTGLASKKDGSMFLVSKGGKNSHWIAQLH